MMMATRQVRWIHATKHFFTFLSRHKTQFISPELYSDTFDFISHITYERVH